MPSAEQRGKAKSPNDVSIIKLRNNKKFTEMSKRSGQRNKVLLDFKRFVKFNAGGDTIGIFQKTIFIINESIKIHIERNSQTWICVFK